MTYCRLPPLVTEYSVSQFKLAQHEELIVEWRDTDDRVMIDKERRYRYRERNGAEREMREKEGGGQVELGERTVRGEIRKRLLRNRFTIRTLPKSKT